jgi:acetyl-CoA C-acetyltransferase
MHRILEDGVAILSAARTPIGRFRGVLSQHDAIALGGAAIGAALARAELKPEVVDTVNMGIVVSAGLGEAPAKAAALRAGIAPTVTSRSVDCVCASALDAVAWGIESLLAGTARVVVAGGMESRTNAPYLLRPTFVKSTRNYRRGEYLRMKRAGAYRFRLSENVEEQVSGTEIIDPTTHDGLFWPEGKRFMREHALALAQERGYSVELVNACAAESHRRARTATEQGLFRDEIAPVGGVGKDELLSEERLQQALAENPDDLASLYNSSTPCDNGAALVLTTARRAFDLGRKPLATVLGYGRVDVPAAQCLAAPVAAVQELVGELAARGDRREFGLIEANEAFAIQIPLFEEAFLGMEMNVHGGAVALGHPFGSAGVRILTTLLYAMRRYGHRRGLATICYGGGGAYAIAVERPE